MLICFGMHYVLWNLVCIMKFRNYSFKFQNKNILSINTRDVPVETLLSLVTCRRLPKKTTNLPLYKSWGCTSSVFLWYPLPNVWHIRYICVLNKLMAMRGESHVLVWGLNHIVFSMKFRWFFSMFLNVKQRYWFMSVCFVLKYLYCIVFSLKLPIGSV